METTNEQNQTPQNNKLTQPDTLSNPDGSTILPPKIDNPLSIPEDIISAELNTQIEIIKRSVISEKGKSLEDIYSNGLEEDRRWLNRFLFNYAEQIEDPKLREQIHRFHFKIALINAGKPDIRLRPNQELSEKSLPMWCIVKGLIQNNIALVKKISGGDKQALLILDYSNFEDLFVQFCKEYHNRINNPGKPILDRGSSPEDFSAVIKAIQTILFKFFGYIDMSTARNNIRIYNDQEKVLLSDFRSSSSSIATCTEISALSHQFLTLTGIVRSELICGGDLNIWDADGTFNEASLDAAHNYQILFYYDGRGNERIFLYDPTNYEKRTDDEKGVTYFWPHIEEITPQQYRDFSTRGKSIVVERPTGATEYYPPERIYYS